MKYLLYIALIVALLFTLTEAQAKTQNFASFARRLARRQRSLVRGFEKENRVRRLHRKNRRQLRRVYARLERRIDSQRSYPRRARRTIVVRAPRPRTIYVQARRRRAVRQAPPQKRYRKESNAAIKTINSLLGDISNRKPKVNIKIHNKKPIVNVNRVKENTHAEIAKIDNTIAKMLKQAMVPVPKFKVPKKKAPRVSERKFIKKMTSNKRGYGKFLKKAEIKGKFHKKIDDFKKRLGLYQNFLTKLDAKKRKFFGKNYKK